MINSEKLTRSRRMRLGDTYCIPVSPSTRQVHQITYAIGSDGLKILYNASTAKHPNRPVRSSYTNASSAYIRLSFMCTHSFVGLSIHRPLTSLDTLDLQTTSLSQERTYLARNQLCLINMHKYTQWASNHE